MTGRTKLLLALAGAASMLLLLAVLTDPRGGGAGRAVEPRRAADAALGESPIVRPPDSAGARALTAVEADGGAPSPETVEEALATCAVVGRCVASGAPAAGAEVTLTLSNGRGRQPPATHERRTGADGRFRIEVPRAPGTTLHLACGGPGLSRWGRQLGALPDAPVLDVGDVPLEPACTLSGTVTSALGLPVAEARVVFRRVFADPREAASPPEMLVKIDGAATDEHGRFESQSLPAAVWDVEVTGLGILGAARRQVDASAGGPYRVDLEVEVAAPVEGVVLVDGLPAKGVPVTCFGAESGQEASFYRRTDAEGRFRLDTRPGWDSGEKLVVRLWSEERALEAEPVPAAWGDVGIVLYARRLPRARVRVVDATSGAPVAEYALRVGETPAFGGRYVTASGPSGEIELEGIPPEGAWIHVLPHDGHRARSPLPIQPGPDAVVVQVEAGRAVDVEVENEDGSPVSGARVEVVALAAGSRPGEAPIVVAADAPALFTKSDAWAFDRAETDAEGRARLALPDLADMELYLRLTGPAGEQAIRPVAPDATRARLVLPTGSTLSLSFSGFWPEAMGLRAEPAAPDAGEAVPRSGFRPSQAREPVVLRGLTPGSWELRATYEGRRMTLATVRLAGEETVELELDAGLFLVPARPIAVRLADGAPAAGELVLEEERLAGFVEVARAPLEGGGTVLPLLPARTYRARLADGTASAVLSPEAWRAATWVLEAVPAGGG